MSPVDFLLFVVLEREIPLQLLLVRTSFQSKIWIAVATTHMYASSNVSLFSLINSPPSVPNYRDVAVTLLCLLILDGANVAYFGNARIHYSSVKGVVEQLLAMGERPLVVIPQKYVQPKFQVSNLKTQKLSPNDLEYIEW
jgi:hypothetical protein